MPVVFTRCSLIFLIEKPSSLMLMQLPVSVNSNSLIAGKQTFVINDGCLSLKYITILAQRHLSLQIK